MIFSYRMWQEKKKKKQNNLQDFSSSGVYRIEYGSYSAETAKMPTKVNLLTFADGLEEKTNKLPHRSLKWSLASSEQKIRMIYHGQVMPLGSCMTTLYQSIQELQHKSNGLEVKVHNIISSLDSAQDFITNHTSCVIVQESKKYGNIIVHFEHYLQWTKISIVEEIEACKPMATTFDSAATCFCAATSSKP